MTYLRYKLLYMFCYILGGTLNNCLLSPPLVTVVTLLVRISRRLGVTTDMLSFIQKSPRPDAILISNGCISFIVLESFSLLSIRLSLEVFITFLNLQQKNKNKIEDLLYRMIMMWTYLQMTFPSLFFKIIKFKYLLS